MESVLEEIKKIRKTGEFVINRSNSNRYCVLVDENDGSKTGYYFSTPIYTKDTGKLIDFAWKEGNNLFYASRSNATAIAKDYLRLENASGGCDIKYLFESVNQTTEGTLKTEKGEIRLTTNGLLCQVKGKENEIQFEVCVDQPFLNEKANNKYFALMKERFQPFVTVSCIGVLDGNGEVCDSILLSYQKIHAKKYKVILKKADETKGDMLFEVNLYEPKLLQDTTVESKHPKMNNAFGGVAFLGKTDRFGTQWLYTRPDLIRHLGVYEKEIRNITLHVPRYNKKGVELGAYLIRSRFCSFGSNWENKTDGIASRMHVNIAGEYCSINLTELLTDKRTRRLVGTNGFILKTKEKTKEFMPVATGDNYYTPQIFEINYVN